MRPDYRSGAGDTGKRARRRPISSACRTGASDRQAPKRSLSSLSAAASCMSGSTCEYTSMVMTVLECAPDVQLRPSGAPRRRAAVSHKNQLTLHLPRCASARRFRCDRPLSRGRPPSPERQRLGGGSTPHDSASGSLPGPARSRERRKFGTKVQARLGWRYSGFAIQLIIRAPFPPSSVTPAG